PPPPQLSPLPLPDALPICPVQLLGEQHPDQRMGQREARQAQRLVGRRLQGRIQAVGSADEDGDGSCLLAPCREPASEPRGVDVADRKSTRLNSSHVKISYA